MLPTFFFIFSFSGTFHETFWNKMKPYECLNQTYSTHRSAYSFFWITFVSTRSQSIISQPFYLLPIQKSEICSWSVHIREERRENYRGFSMNFSLIRIFLIKTDWEIQSWGFCFFGFAVSINKHFHPIFIVAPNKYSHWGNCVKCCHTLDFPEEIVVTKVWFLLCALIWESFLKKI